MNRLVFTPLAESDLHEILTHIAEHRPLTAVAVVSRIRKKCELLESQPQIGQKRPEFPGDYRSTPVERWVIFYRYVGFIEFLTAPAISTA
jgi:toxin ParE1/3/4